MPRRPRNAAVTVGGTYHVIARGNNKMRIFYNEEDYEYYYALLDATARSLGVSIHHYCLMPNHVHILLTTTGDLPLFMQVVQAAYAKRYCRVYKHVGHVWSGRYKSPRIDSDAYLYSCGNYVEMNPKRARIVAKPEDWKWSSYRTYAFGKYDRLVTLDPFYSSIGTTDEEHQSRYRAYVDKTRAKQ